MESAQSVAPRARRGSERASARERSNAWDMEHKSRSFKVVGIVDGQAAV